MKRITITIFSGICLLTSSSIFAGRTIAEQAGQAKTSLPADTAKKNPVDPNSSTQSSSTFTTSQAIGGGLIGAGVGLGLGLGTGAAAIIKDKNKKLAAAKANGGVVPQEGVNQQQANAGDQQQGVVVPPEGGVNQQQANAGDQQQGVVVPPEEGVNQQQANAGDQQQDVVGPPPVESRNDIRIAAKQGRTHLEGNSDKFKTVIDALNEHNKALTAYNQLFAQKVQSIDSFSVNEKEAKLKKTFQDLNNKIANKLKEFTPAKLANPFSVEKLHHQALTSILREHTLVHQETLNR